VILISSKENLDRKINFRVTEEVYKKLMAYLKHTQDTISVVMREATYDFLKLKEVFEENGYVVAIIKKEKKEEEEYSTEDLAQIEANKFCDADGKCDIDPRKRRK